MFKLISKFKPTGDQPEAIDKLTKGIKSGKKHQTLLGVTGSGKTFTIANVIANMKMPTLVVSHNKTLAAQLYQEFKEFFPNNAVHYFVSYYDYYQPEAYIPHSDTYIEKDSKINEEIDRLRHSTTQALLSRDDVIVVASVSCIYNLGSPADYSNLSLDVFEGQQIKPSEVVGHLVRLQYGQELELKRGTFRKSTSEIEVVSATGDRITRIRFSTRGGSTSGGGVSKIASISVADGVELDEVFYQDPKFEKIIETKIFPAKYWIATNDKIDLEIQNIRAELQQHTRKLEKQGLYLQAERLKSRTEYDMDMIKTAGYCHGIENYSRHIDFRKPSEPPYTLLDFFSAKSKAASGGKTKKEFLTIIDESHISIPQIRGMHAGDESRKTTLVEHGFRLPSALDNRPLRFDEFDKRIGNRIYVSATPGLHELKKSGVKNIAEQLVRPTGLLDPTIQIQPTKEQIPHLISEIRNRISKGQRSLITTLTKRMAEDLSEHLADQGIKVNYIHSEIKTLDRLEIIRDLRLGRYDVIVGVNLLREGLDLPEVSLIAILDADKEGFLRNATTLIQTMGRAARHQDGHIIMYADKITRSMDNAIKETERRRKIQEEYNKKFDITPTSIQKEIGRSHFTNSKKQKISRWTSYDPGDEFQPERLLPRQRLELLEKEMQKAVKKLQFERAMTIREEVLKLRKTVL